MKAQDVIVGTPESNRHMEDRTRQVIAEFADKLIKESKPLPPEFSKTVDKHFWELF